MNRKKPQIRPRRNIVGELVTSSWSFKEEALGFNLGDDKGIRIEKKLGIQNSGIEDSEGNIKID